MWGTSGDTHRTTGGQSLVLLTLADRGNFVAVLSIGQVTAARAAFKLAGYPGEIRTLPVNSEDERIFVLPQDDLLRITDVRSLEQVLTQLLGRKVWVLASIDDDTVPFG